MVGVFADCAVNPNYECDRTGAAIVLAPGDTISLLGRACFEGTDGYMPGGIVIVEGEDFETAPVRISVMDSMTGTEIGGADAGQFGLYFAPSHCDEGFVITVENTMPAYTGPLTAFVLLVAGVEEFDRCEVFVEAP